MGVCFQPIHLIIKQLEMGKVEIGSEKIYSFMKSCVYSLTQLEMLLLALLLLLD